MDAYPEDEVGVMLSGLAASGTNMSSPLLIEFMVDVPDDEEAMSVEEALGQIGYQTETTYDDGEPDEAKGSGPSNDHVWPSWTVCVKVTIVPDYHEITRIQSELASLARPFGGACTGWRVPVE